MKVDFFMMMESLLALHNIKMKRVKLADLQAKEQDALQETLLFTSNKQKMKQLAAFLKPYHFQILHDQLGLSYAFFSATGELREEYQFDFVAIGPYLAEPLTEEEIKKRVVANGLSLEMQKKLSFFYDTIPLLAVGYEMSALLALIGKTIYGDFSSFTIEESDLRFDLPEREITFELNENPYETMVSLEERYDTENRMLEAVSNGDISKALLEFTSFIRYRVTPRTKGEIRDKKNLSFALNTMLRRAVESGFVHPIYIDEISGQFSRRIEETASLEEIISLQQEMIFSYTNLVKKYSLKGYSPTIRKIIDYIKLNYAENISLKKIADLFSISPSYLSSLFKKETNTTLTDYINTKRIEASLPFLAHTDYLVQDIANRVGFPNVNYYTRLFKKHKGMTPHAYREKAQKP